MKSLRNTFFMVCKLISKTIKRIARSNVYRLEQALALTNTAEQERRLRIFETNYGRDAGWFVERDGLRLALLTDCRFEDMFWDSYKIEPLVEDPMERAALLESPELWLSCEFTYRNQLFEDGVVESAFVAEQPFWEPGRVSMRGLYLIIGEPMAKERLLLRLREANVAK